MNLQDILIIVVAALIGFGYLLLVRSYDIYEKEPLIKLLLVAVVGGLISVFVSLFLYEFVEVNYNFVDAIIKIGFIEEFSKLFALVVVYQFIKKDFNEIVDGIIYITAVSLGFAVIENVFYANNSEDPFNLLILRSIYAIIGHISFSGYMGIAFYIHKRIHKNYVGLLLSVVLASLAHGFYDGVIFQPELTFLFQTVFVVLIFLQLRLLKTTLGFSKFREKFREELFIDTEHIAFLFCDNCNSSVRSTKISFWKMQAGKCETCNNIVLSSGNIIRLFQYFRPILNSKKYLRKMSKMGGIITLDDEDKILFNTKKNFLSANINGLGNWLNEQNERDIKDILKIPVLGIILKYLGLRYFVEDIKQE